MSEEKPTLELVWHKHEIHLVDTGLHKGPPSCRAIFFGPDREANAALFIRAQHMDELVKAATVAKEYLDDLAVEAETDNWHPLAKEGLRRRANMFHTILAKIDQHKEKSND